MQPLTKNILEVKVGNICILCFFIKICFLWHCSKYTFLYENIYIKIVALLTTRTLLFKKFVWGSGQFITKKRDILSQPWYQIYKCKCKLIFCWKKNSICQWIFSSFYLIIIKVISFFCKCKIICLTRIHRLMCASSETECISV